MATHDQKQVLFPSVILANDCNNKKKNACRFILVMGLTLAGLTSKKLFEKLWQGFEVPRDRFRGTGI